MPEEDEFEIDMDAPIAKVIEKRKLQLRSKKKKKLPEVAGTYGGEGLQVTAVVEDSGNIPPGMTVSLFDYSVENHFKAVETIAKLCGEPETPDFDPAEINRLSSSIKFLREWRYFNYKPRKIRFACSNEIMNGKDVIGEISLPQFSAAAVPKKETLNGNAMTPHNKDFVLYAGGSVWALDWCPRVVHQHSGCKINMEFVAVAAHPPDSSYHKIGAPLTGRGVIQIWCVLNIGSEEYLPSQVQKKRKHKSGKVQTKNSKRGRPRKKPVNEPSDNADSGRQIVAALGTQYLEDSNYLLSVDMAPKDNYELIAGTGSEEDLLAEVAIRQREDSGKYVAGNAKSTKPRKPRKPRGKSRKNCLNESSDDVASCTPIIEALQVQYPEEPSDLLSVPKDVALPRMMLCLAHNGKTAWDVKWKPSDSHNKHTMGYLAVALGNGALEVWEVPFPRTVEAIYPACQMEGTDPRFMKLEPVFRCSKLKSCDRQSIPLTVEWSVSSPHDMILAGCHDGVVALWKFSAAGSCKETRPLLCFSADTVPIRALAWAPAESDSEGANVIVTAGHKGMKFWDIRDPFRPLWDFNPIQTVIYSLDWVADPRCVVVSFDDGTLRTLSLMKAAYDVPVTGKPFDGKPQQGYSSYLCSTYAIWSVHVSRQTGMVAYCGADGNALRFQLTTRAVERDPIRNRVPHFLCGSLSEEESTLTVITQESDTPFPMKKSTNELSTAPRTKRGFVSRSNQKKRAKEEMAKNQTSVEQPLALYNGNDPGTEDDSDPSTPQKSKQAHKSKATAKGKSNNSKTDKKALTCIDKDFEISENEAEEVREVADELESLPSKMVAIHTVRWNMNKGSGKWLSYGGAAGVVRCQEIDISIC